MNITHILASAGLVVASLGAATAADAQNYGGDRQHQYDSRDQQTQGDRHDQNRNDQRDQRNQGDRRDHGNWNGGNRDDHRSYRHRDDRRDNGYHSGWQNHRGYSRCHVEWHHHRQMRICR